MAGLTIYIDDKDLVKAQKGYSWTDAQKTTPKETKPQGKYNVVATDGKNSNYNYEKNVTPDLSWYKDPLENTRMVTEQPIEPLYGFKDPVFNLAFLGAGLANGAMKGITKIGEKVVTNKPLWTAISANNIKNRIEDEGFVEGVLGHPVQTTFDLLMLGPAAKGVKTVGNEAMWKYTPEIPMSMMLNKGVKNFNPQNIVPKKPTGNNIVDKINYLKETEKGPSSLLIPKNKNHNITKLGDLETNNSNLMYHVDNGNNTGFVGGITLDGNKLIPGPAKIEGQPSYIWWNEGEPYVNLQSSDRANRVITMPKTNDFLRIRDSKTPIGQWNGEKGFVTAKEYVTPEIDISNGSAYTFNQEYGYVKLPTTKLPSFTTWEDILSLRPQGINPQIKPLIEGADIEKQLSKTGTINRKQLDSYISKQKEYYQEVMNDVLNEEFNGIDKIDYAKFKSAVANRLPEYNRVNQTEYSTYGMDRLGYKVIKEPDGTGGILEYSPYTKVNTFTFETPNIYGDTRHYSGNPIGHSRTFVTTSEPDVLHVMESQSDWAQNFQPVVRRTENGKDLPVASKLTQQHLAKNYTERQIQENLKYAAENGLTKMRYPTRETAARIEGYGEPSHVYSTEDYTNIYNDFMNQKKNLRKKYNIPEDLKYLSKEELDNFFDPGEYENPTLAYNTMLEKINKLNKEDVLNYNIEFSQIVRPDQWVKQQPLGYRPEIETILKKYDSFPKQFKKLFGDKYEVRIVRDNGPTYNRTNSWYEVDIPESYRNKTAQIIFKSGGVQQKQSGGEQQGGPTHLQPWDEQRFRMWFNTLPEGIRNSNDYDYRGWWLENGSIPYKQILSGNGHFTDKYKLPNHPTFSNQSIYSKGNTIGGQWINNDMDFVPSQYNVRNGSDRIINTMEFADKGSKMFDTNGMVAQFKDGGPTGLTIFIDDEQFKKGGQIHIKEKNKGKFTKQAQSAGMSVQEFARHVLAHKNRYPASTVKRANFARNASKWSK